MLEYLLVTLAFVVFVFGICRMHERLTDAMESSLRATCERLCPGVP